MSDPAAETAEQHLNAGDAHSRRGELDQALACYRSALAIRPDHAQAQYNLGVGLRDQGRWTEAAAAFQAAVILRPNSAEAHNNLGIALQRLGQLDEAMSAYERAIEIKPDHAKAHYNLGLALAHLGWMEDAAAAYRRALVLDPTYAAALYNLTLQTPMNDGRPETEAAFRLLSRQADAPDRIDPKARSLLLFAMGKALEDREEFDRAFSYLTQANAVHRAGLSFDIGQAERRMKDIAEVFGRPLFSRLGGAGLAGDRPIFIVGMARSGTTLIEQIISAHPQVLGAGEISNLPQLVASVEGPGATPYPGWAQGLTGVDCDRIGSAYLQSLPAGAPGQTRLVDKTLINVEHLGLIHLCLPQARIIHCRRDPRDIGLSCFASRFSDGQGYAYDLAEIGRYWRAHDRLMAHWRAVLPAGRILEAPYEEVIDDVEPWARRLITHCGLSWDEACLKFHESERLVSTGSFAQVRRPIYKGSVGRWRRFARHLGPLVETLGEGWED